MITETLILWHLHCDRRAERVMVPKAHLEKAIRDAATAEGWTGQFPWETGAEYEKRTNHNP